MRRGKPHMTGQKKGRILVIALLVMVVGGIIMAGLFLYLNTSLLFVSRSEAEAVNFYAADSGIEEAISWLQRGQVENDWWECDEGDPQQCERDPYTINHRDVDIEIVKASEIDDQTYKITSIATGDDGTGTTIVSYVSVEEQISLVTLANALISHGDLKGSGWNEVDGGAIYVNDLLNWDDGQGDPPTHEGEIPDWPDAEELKATYWEDVKELAPYPADIITCDTDTSLGPLYRDGDLEIIWGSSDVTITLEGTIYVTGNLKLNPTQNAVLDMNGHTIFVEGKIDDIGSNLVFSGSGAVQAIGDVIIASNVTSDPLAYLLVMSVSAMLKAGSDNQFYGTVAGYTLVEVGSDNDFLYTGDSDQEAPYIADFPSHIITYDIIDR
jgi:hypothetical protein